MSLQPDVYKRQRDLITEALGAKWRPIRGYEDTMHINKISAKMTAGCNDRQACLELSQYYDEMCIRDRNTMRTLYL